VIAAGHFVLEGILGQPDGESVTRYIDALPDDTLRLLAFERVWQGGREGGSHDSSFSRWN